MLETLRLYNETFEAHKANAMGRRHWRNSQPNAYASCPIPKLDWYVSKERALKILSEHPKGRNFSSNLWSFTNDFEKGRFSACYTIDGGEISPVWLAFEPSLVYFIGNRDAFGVQSL